MTTTLPAEAPAPQLLMLNPATLLLDGNVRRSAQLDKDFLASVNEHGVLVPIVAVRTAQGEHRVRYGQRRTLAALEVGRSQVPVVVLADELATDAAAIERIVTQVHENEFRAGLSAADRAGAVEQLAAFGLSAAEIHQHVKGSKQGVTDALAVAASPLAKKATERYDFLTLDQAAIVAEFEDDPSAAKALIAAAKKSTGTFNHVAQTARDERDRAKAHAAITARLTKAKVKIVKAVGYHDTTAKKLTDLVADEAGKSITPTGHKACPGHAAYIGPPRYSGQPEAIYVCTAWKSHGHRDRYQPATVAAAAMTSAEREKASADRRRVIEGNKSWKSAETVRRSWLKQLLSRKSAPKGAAAFVAIELAHASHELGQALEFSGAALLYELLGVKDRPTHIAACEKATDARAQILALAFVLAAYEAKTGTHTSSWPIAPSPRRRHW